MSNPHPSSGSEADRDAEHGRSAGEEQLEREDELKREEARKGEERPRDEERPADAEAEEDAEEVGSEWHVWILALLVVAGIALFFAPRFFLPELLGSLGALLVVIGVLGWLVRWAIARSG